MFNEDFFPTPKDVIKKMLKPYKYKSNDLHLSNIYGLRDYSILEPSAGSGNILDFISKHTNNENLYCIENNPELQHILRDKDYNLIDNDFLNYSGDHYFDLILMNPPFSKGADHLLKAWDILKNGDVVCLLNAETINNPYTEKRKLILKLIDDFGSVENLGNCFSTAERKTNVEVVLIRLTKTVNENDFNFHFENKTNETNHFFNEESFKNPLAVNDIIENLLIQYDETKTAFMDYIKAIDKLQFYSKGLLNSYDDIIKFAESAINTKNYHLSYNHFVNRLKYSAWQNILDKSNVARYMTSAVRNNFNKFSEKQGMMDLTKENIFDVIDMLFQNRDNILKQAILDVFDIFTRYHKENRSYFEGWKTNDSWKVNRKIILPNWCKYGEYLNNHDLKKYGDTFKTQFSKEYADIDKALCYLSRKKYENINPIYDTLENHFHLIGKVYPGDKFNNECESTFFKIKFYRKGTIHLYFKDKSLWEQFNLFVCKEKNWLPPQHKSNTKTENSIHKQTNEVKELCLF
jgi:hypothetical protein